MCSTSILFFIASHVCYVSSTCCAKLEFGLLFYISWTCSLKRVRKCLPVYPRYFNGQLLHFSW
jgi:hypothetical protein